jgi:hypothetical protein
MEENVGGPGFQPLPTPAKLSWLYLTTPEDEKCGTAAPGCSFPEQARAPALHRQEVVHGKSLRRHFFSVKIHWLQKPYRHYWKDINGLSPY